MWNTGLDEAQTGIKIVGRNINNLRYAGDITLMAESEEALKRLLMEVKEASEEACLKFNIQKSNSMASGPERVTGRKARGLQMEEIGCKCQTFLISLLSSRRKQTTSVRFFSLFSTNLKRGFF